MNIGAIIQARTSSTRLPNKILKELPYSSGTTVLQNVIRRLERTNKLERIIVATTDSTSDEEIVKIAEKEGVRWFRGSMNDVLERYYLAAKENNLDVIVRITSDCPCIDSEIVDLVIQKHLNANSDYTSNILVRTFPHGLDTEVVTFAALENVYYQARQNFEREHVTPYIYKTNPNLFKITIVEAPDQLSSPDIRVTLDTEEDYALLCAVYDFLYPLNNFFSTKDLIGLFRKKPWLKLINKNVVQKTI